jgi:outer membrane protein assembly factor BamB
MLSRRDALRLTAGAAVVTSPLSGAYGVSASEGGLGWEKPRYDTANTANAPSGPGVLPRKRWSIDFGVVGTPVVAEGRVFFADSDGTVYALDADEGNRLWEFGTDGTVESPVSYADGVVYVTADTVTYALEAEGGTERWTHRGTGATDSAAVADGDVYVAKSSSVYALGFHTGTVLWEYQASGVVSATPALSGGNLYVADESGTVQSLDAEDGSIRWKKGAASSVESAPAVTRDAVYVVGTYGRVRSLDRSDGDERWTEELFTRIDVPPAVDDDRLYVGTQEGVRALSVSNGRTDWTFEEGNATAPSLGGGTVYVGVDGALHALDAETGEVVWRKETPGASSSAVTRDTVYVGTNFGLSALREETPSPDVSIAEASTDATDVSVGETVTVTVELKNAGGADGVFVATLYADGRAIEGKETTVGKGERNELSFTTSFDESGEYRLRVNTENIGKVAVVGDEEETQTEPETEETEQKGDEKKGEEKEENGGFVPTDLGAGEAVAVTATVVALTTAAFAYRVTRWYRN